MKKSQKSAVIFDNIMMILFYSSIFVLMISFFETIINQEVHILFYVSSITLILSIFSGLLVERLDEPMKSNITYNAKWRIKKK